MIYSTAIDTFYLTDDQLKNSSPSRKDGIDETTETNLRIYGCDLIQESGILLRLPQVVMATGQVLFHRFYCKQSFASFNVKSVAASCVWLASKLEESPRKAKHVLIVFHRMECRRRGRENLPIDHQQHLLKMDDLNRTERYLLKEMGFVCHVEHPHKFISNYLATLVGTSHPELRQEAWNLANDSLRTTLCVRFKSEVVACGVVYAAARRFRVPLPDDENHHPWWKVFDAEKSAIDEVCKVLAHLYSLPKAQYITVCKAGEDTFASSNKSQTQQVPKDGSLNEQEANNYDTRMAKVTSLPTSLDSGGTNEALKAAALDKLKESKKGDDDAKKTTTTEGESRVLEPVTKSKVEQRTEVSGAERMNREKERLKIRKNDGGRDSDREREWGKMERERDKLNERSHRSSRHHPSRERGDYHTSSYSNTRQESSPTPSIFKKEMNVAATLNVLLCN